MSVVVSVVVVVVVSVVVVVVVSVVVVVVVVIVIFTAGCHYMEHSSAGECVQLFHLHAFTRSRFNAHTI